MNCIILLFLLGCCGGWGNGRGNCCCNNGCRGNDNDCGCRQNGCRNGRNRENCCREDSVRDGCGCQEERHCHKEDDCGCREERRRNREDDCGCQRERHHHKEEDCDCQEERNRCGCEARESCDVPGMVPPPWQDYPPFPRRDNRED